MRPAINFSCFSSKAARGCGHDPARFVRALLPRSARVYADRIIGGDRDHRHFGRHASAGARESKDQGAIDSMRRESSPNYSRRKNVFRRFERETRRALYLSALRAEDDDMVSARATVSEQHEY